MYVLIKPFTNFRIKQPTVCTVIPVTNFVVVLFNINEIRHLLRHCAWAREITAWKSRWKKRYVDTLFTSRYLLNMPYRVNSLVFIDHGDSRPMIFSCMKQRFTLFSLKKIRKSKIHDSNWQILGPPKGYNLYHKLSQ